MCAGGSVGVGLASFVALLQFEFVSYEFKAGLNLAEDTFGSPG